MRIRSGRNTVVEGGSGYRLRNVKYIALALLGAEHVSAYEFNQSWGFAATLPLPLQLSALRNSVPRPPPQDPSPQWIELELAAHKRAS